MLFNKSSPDGLNLHILILNMKTGRNWILYYVQQSQICVAKSPELRTDIVKEDAMSYI